MNQLPGKIREKTARIGALALALSLLAFTAAAPALAQEHAPVTHDAPAHAEGAAAGEHGAGHGGGEHHATLDPKKLAFQFINFAILVGVLGFFGGKAINGALAARYDQMKRDLEEAATARAAAEVRLAEQEKRLANLEREVAALKAAIKEEAEKEQKLLLTAAEEKARRIVDETRFLMDQQVKEAEARFKDEVADAAVKIAEQIVRRSFRPEDEARLNQTFIAELEGIAPGGAGTNPSREVRI